MTTICGVEIKSKTACFIILQGTKKEFKVVESMPLKIELSDYTSQESIKAFAKEIAELFRTYEVEKVMVKEGVSKGKFSSGAAVFKIETIIQMSDVEVELVKPLILKTFFKNESIELEKEGLKKYQYVAHDVAYYGLES